MIGGDEQFTRQQYYNCKIEFCGNRSRRLWTLMGSLEPASSKLAPLVSQCQCSPIMIREWWDGVLKTWYQECSHNCKRTCAAISSNRWIWTGIVVYSMLSIRSQWCSLEPFDAISSSVWRERWQMESWRRRCVLNYQRDARSIRYRSGSSGKDGVGRSEAAFGVFVIHRSSFWARLRVRWTARIRIRSWRRWRRGERLICEWWHIV